MEEYDDSDTLSSIYAPSLGVYVTSRPVQQSNLNSNNNNNAAIDEFFTVNLHYEDHCNPSAEKRVTFMIDKRESDAIFSSVYNVMETLDDPEGKSYDCVIDVVKESCELLLEDVSRGSRRSLAMNVKVDVYHVNDDDDDDEPMYDYDDDDGHDDDVHGCMDEDVDDDDDDDEEVCAICLDAFVKTYDDVAVLCCSHNLHQNCLKPWILAGKNTCPLCRSNIMILEIVDINQVKKILKV